MATAQLLWGKYFQYGRDGEAVLLDPVTLESVLLDPSEVSDLAGAPDWDRLEADSPHAREDLHHECESAFTAAGGSLCSRDLWLLVSVVSTNARAHGIL
ncbi:hypothetical protein [Streptomyces sp. NPDC051577]|uniref:hypothetical protein n=1 Tax=Streptomyces sp. NPDC051577 TaxID=3155166 RepID=UPI00342C209D